MDEISFLYTHTTLGYSYWVNYVNCNLQYLTNSMKATASFKDSPKDGKLGEGEGLNVKHNVQTKYFSHGVRPQSA